MEIPKNRIFIIRESNIDGMWGENCGGCETVYIEVYEESGLDDI